MGFFDKLLRGKSVTEPEINFGRYSDAYRSVAQQAFFDKSMIAFEKGEYLEAYQYFFEFLKDENVDNVKYWETEKGLEFELLQGSKKVIGIADEERVEVETKVAVAETLEINVMKRLMERNYSLMYGRFALDDKNGIIMKFNTYVIDGSPYKLYDALKEVATHADKLDDLLLDEFKSLKSVDTGHIKELTESEKAVKYDYLIKYIETTLAEVRAMKGNVPGINRAYCLMSLCYKLDYLIRPEGFVMEILERINRLYFAHDEKSIAEKCELLEQEYENILNRPKVEILKEFYQTTSTFGVTMPVHHDRVRGFIDGEMPNIEWYIKHGRNDIALYSTSYVVGYCLFNYAVPLPDKAYFHLFYQITNSDYFQDLGFSDLYQDKIKVFNKSAIKNKINAIAKAYKKEYQNLNPQTEILDFTDMASFTQTYLEMISRLNLS
jgi:hypothetical protein